MTPEAQRIAIAEACGWEIALKGMVPECLQHAKSPGGVWEYFNKVPDYLNDLNACHEMEKVLTEEQWESFCIHLVGSGPYYCSENRTTLRIALRAAPAKHCEAFLRALNLWKEET